jgi:hypothetical protein
VEIAAVVKAGGRNLVDQHHFARSEGGVSAHRETGHTVHTGGAALALRVVDVDEAVRGEGRIDGNAEDTLFL